MPQLWCMVKQLENEFGLAIYTKIPPHNSTPERRGYHAPLINTYYTLIVCDEKHVNPINTIDAFQLSLQLYVRICTEKIISMSMLFSKMTKHTRSKFTFRAI